MTGSNGSLHADLPLKVVAIGGGTGLAALLRALKPEAGRARDPWKLTGIVTVSELRASISRTGLPVVYVANLMTEPGESTGMSLEDHVAAIQAFAGFALTGVIANTTPLPENLRRRYAQEGGIPLTGTTQTLCGVRVHSYAILDPEAEMARHHPVLLNHAIREVIASL